MGLSKSQSERTKKQSCWKRTWNLFHIKEYQEWWSYSRVYCLVLGRDLGGFWSYFHKRPSFGYQYNSELFPIIMFIKVTSKIYWTKFIQKLLIKTASTVSVISLAIVFEVQHSSTWMMAVTTHYPPHWAVYRYHIHRYLGIPSIGIRPSKWQSSQTLYKTKKILRLSVWQLRKSS